MKNFIYIILVFTFSSCMLFKKADNNDYLKVSADTVKNYQDSLLAYNINYNTLQYRFLAKYTKGDQKLTMYGKYLNINDSVIYANFSPGFGLIAAELYATKDTAFFYIPLQNTVYVGSDDLFLNKFNIAIDFGSIHSLACANVFSYPYFSNLSDYKPFSAVVDTIAYLNIILNKRNPKIADVEHLFYCDYNNMNVSSTDIRDYVLNKFVSISYTDYKYIDTLRVPSFIDITLIDVDTTSLSLTIKNVEFNKELDINFNFPDNEQIINF